MRMPDRPITKPYGGARANARAVAVPSRLGPAWRDMLRVEASPHAVGLGLATGVFVAFLPILGVQMLMAAVIAWVGRAHIGAALLGTWAGNPITWPLMWVTSYLIGITLLGDAGVMTIEELQRAVARLLEASPGRLMEGALAILWPVMKPLFVGSLILGIGFGGVLYVVGRRAAEAFHGRRKPQV